MKLPMLPVDKANHALYGAALFAVFGGIALLLGMPPLLAKQFGGSAAVAFGAGKEAVDAWLNYRATGNWRVGPHGVEIADAVATVGGAALCWIAAVATGG